MYTGKLTYISVHSTKQFCVMKLKFELLLRMESGMKTVVSCVKVKQNLRQHKTMTVLITISLQSRQQTVILRFIMLIMLKLHLHQCYLTTLSFGC